MHPLHVLASRLHNLYKLPSKQNALGAAQLRALISVMRPFAREIASASFAAPAADTLLLYAREIEHLARLDAARKVAKRHSIYIADAIEVEVIDNDSFRSKKVPRLVSRMSPQRAAEIQDFFSIQRPVIA